MFALFPDEAPVDNVVPEFAYVLLVVLVAVLGSIVVVKVVRLIDTVHLPTALEAVHVYWPSFVIATDLADDKVAFVPFDHL